VFIVGSDPVQLGFVTSLNRPGGNLTGINFFSQELEAKRLGLLHDLVPGAREIAFLTNLGRPDAAEQIKAIQEAARQLGLGMRVLNAQTAGEIEAGFATLAQQGVDGLVVDSDPILDIQHDKILALVAQARLPAIYGNRGWVQGGAS
jgi:putative ABC transport system substrate-binding protein